MKNIIIKTILTLLLIIEFYPIESNGQTKTGTGDKYLVYLYPESKINRIENESKVFLIKFNVFNELKERRVNIRIYNDDGIIIESLVEGIMEPGEYSVYFKPDEGQTSENYYYETEIDGSKQVEKINLSKR